VDNLHLIGGRSCNYIGVLYGLPHAGSILAAGDLAQDLMDKAHHQSYILALHEIYEGVDRW
jgi:hypothetical protein